MAILVQTRKFSLSLYLAPALTVLLGIGEWRLGSKTTIMWLQEEKKLMTF